MGDKEKDLLQATETDLFRKISLLLLDSNKEHLEELKEKLSLYANVEVDNSGFVRAFIEYLYENQDVLHALVPYVIKYKGFNILQEFMGKVKANASLQEIENEIGISVKLIEKLEEKYKG